MIIDKLIDKIIETNSPIVVGLDPKIPYIPEYIIKDCIDKYGKSPKAIAEAFLIFNKEIINEIFDIIPAIKPQIAMYEMLGSFGIESYIETIKYAKSKGLIVIGDIKRCDISSTAEYYSDGHIGKIDIFGEKFEIYSEDFITLSPYIGIDSIEPYFNNCKEYEKGLFILVKTSNPNSGEIQDLDIGNKRIYEKVGELTSKWGKEFIGKHNYSSIGAVVGATHKKQAENLRNIMPNTFFLVPGYGAQGGTSKEISVCFDKNGLGAIINSSRGIISAHQNEKYKHNYSEKEFAKASREAVIDMKNDINKYRYK